MTGRDYLEEHSKFPQDHQLYVIAAIGGKIAAYRAILEYKPEVDE